MRVIAMRISLHRTSLFLAFLLAAGAAAASTLSPSAVLAESNQLNGQKISVAGVITSLQAKTSADGKSYQTFRLCDATACLNVYTRDTGTYTPGAQYTASGRFWAVRHEGYKTRYNELVLPEPKPAATTH